MDRQQYTIRAPKELLDRVREEASIYGESMNDLVIAAVEKEVLLRKGLRLVERIENNSLKMAARGIQPDSAPLIRQLRLGGERHK